MDVIITRIKYRDPFWVIATTEEPNFWRNTFATLSEAKAYCAYNNFNIIKIYK